MRLSERRTLSLIHAIKTGNKYMIATSALEDCYVICSLDENKSETKAYQSKNIIINK